MVAVDQDARLGFVVKEGTKIDPAYHVPTPPVLFLISLLDVLRCVLQVSDLALHHLVVDILSDLQCVLPHVHLHVAELDVCADLHSG